MRRASETGVTVKERFVYDDQMRMKQHYHQVDSNAEVLLADNTYNELSQLSNKKVGNNLQSIDYAYNIRGWMTDINKGQMSLPDMGGKLFAYKIKYTKKDGIENPSTSLFPGKNVKAKYNGNIAEVDWRAVEVIGQNPPTTPERYGYAYDPLNRLTAGYYQNPNDPYSKENTESLAYDLNGNITNLYRTSVKEAATNIATKIDDLSYTYTGNRVTKITDASNNFAGYEGGGRPISYDANGNMTDMRDKGILGITYNYLNLPRTISRDLDSFSVDYLYRADGVKLNKTILEQYDGINGTVSVTNKTDYLDGFHYNNKIESGGQTAPGGEIGVADPDEDGAEVVAFEESPMRRAMEETAFTPAEFQLVGDPGLEPGIDPPRLGGGFTGVITAKTPDLQFFPTAEGFYDYAKDQYIYQYKDHLGNTRISFGRNSAGVLEITDANDYYPFGMNHFKTGSAFFGQGSYKSYKFQEQELQETGFYAFKWRQYMPDVGRFFNIDPLSEKYSYQSHYNFSENRVIDGRELEGLEWSGIHYKNTDGSQRIDNSAHYKVLNSSSRMTNDEVKIRTNEIMKQTETTYSGTDSQGIAKTLSTTVEYVDSVNPLTDYYIEFVDKIEGGTSPLVLGRVDEIGDSQSNRIQVLSFLGNGTGAVGTHEVGHTTGLRHGNDSNNSPEVVSSMTYDNIMNDGSKISPVQLNEIQKNIPTTIKIQIDENKYVTPFSNE